MRTDGVVKEGRPKFNLRPGRGLNQGPSGWQSEVSPTVTTSHTLSRKNDLEQVLFFLKSSLSCIEKLFKSVEVAIICPQYGYYFRKYHEQYIKTIKMHKRDW